MAAFETYGGRALFITGDNDPEGMTGRRLFMPFCKAHHIRADFRLVEGANHSYYDPDHAERVVEESVAWLKTNPDAPTEAETGASS